MKLPVRSFFAFCGGFLAISSLAFANEELVQVDQKSQPLGFVDKVSAIAIGKPITTVQPKLTQDGYAFGYWTAGSERLSSTNEQSLITATVNVQGPLVLTAHYFPEDQDSDSDNLPDWFEYRNFGNLSKSGTDDPDDDGFTLSQENHLGQSTIIPDSIEDGGISFSVSDPIKYGDSSNTYKVTLQSDPFGFVTTKTDYFLKDSNLATISLFDANNGYHFAYWSINGVRQAAPNGSATQQANYLLNEDKIITAHYIPSDQDSDQDGIADWFEMNQFGNLNQDSQSDPDLDGFSNAKESQLGQVSLIKDEIEDGGISFSSYPLISYAGSDLVSYKIISQPAGFFDNINNAASKDSLISTPNLNGEKNGYHFAYWSLNGLRQASASGVAVSQVNLLIEESSELIAHFIPSEQDEDGDGLMDWFELNQFGNLNQGNLDDPDRDDFSNLQEKELGQEPLIPDLVVDGGISFAASTKAFYYIQAYDRLEGIELNNTITLGMQDSGMEIGSFSALDSIWDPQKIRTSRFELVSGLGAADNHRFKINNGVLTTNESLVPGTYSIRVRAVNFLNIFTEESFIITAETPPPPPNRAPSFVLDQGVEVLEVSVGENEFFIGRLKATDPDSDAISFLLHLEDQEKDHSNIVLNPITGELSFKIAPDFEKPWDKNKDNSYDIVAIVTDGSLSDTLSIKVQINDVEEFTPLTGFQLLSSKIEENKNAGTLVGKFSASSNQESASIEYQLVSGEGAEANANFTISNDQLLTTRSLDFESSPTLSIRVSAQKGNQDPLEKVFLIQVMDVFENTPPKFSSFNGENSALLQQPENQAFVTSLKASDIDDQNLTYQLSQSVDSQFFEISATTGVLNFTEAPDFESPKDANGDNIYEIEAVVSDGQLSDSVSIKIQINDVNELTPLSDFQLNTAKIEENKDKGTIVGQFSSASNQESAQIEYKLVSGDGADANDDFNITNNNLLTNRAFDFENSSKLSIRVRAQKGNLDPLEKVFLIQVVDVFENSPPSFISFDGASSISLKHPENQSFITTLKATDIDNQNLAFQLSQSGDSQFFEISNTTGELRFAQAPDFESPRDANKDNIYEIEALVSDGQLSDKLSITLQINDLNEITPIADFQLLSARVEENKQSGTVAGRFFSESNQNFAPIEYKLVPGDGAEGNANFSISKDQLLTTRSLDYESSSTLSIRVSAHKGNLDPMEKSFRIQVMDVFENTPPNFSSFNGASSASVEHPENQTFVTALKANDIDNQVLTYHLSESPDAGFFEISKTTGVLRFINVPDFETPKDKDENGVYEVTLKVSDGLAIDQLTLSISIKDSLQEDTDRDGLDDKTEISLGTDPKKADTDGDGFPDGMEVKLGTDPKKNDDFPGSGSGFNFSSLKVVQANDDSAGEKSSKVEFNAEEGTTYYFSLDGANEARGLAMLDFEFSNDSGDNISSSSLSDSTPQSLSDLFGSNEEEIKELVWKAPQSGIAKILLADIPGGAQLTLFEQAIDGLKELSEDFLSEEKPHMYFKSEQGKSYLIQLELGLGDLSFLDTITESDPEIAVEIARVIDGPSNDAFADRTPIRNNNLSITGTFDQASSELGEGFHADLPPPQKSIWWKWNAPSDGSLTLTNQSTTPTNFAVYAGWAVDDLIKIAQSQSSNLSAPIQLEVKAGVEYAIVASRYEGNAGGLAFDFAFSASGQSINIQNNDLADASTLNFFSGSVSGSNLGADGELGEPSHGDTAPPVNSIWWKWQAPGTGKVTIDTHGSDIDTVLAFYEGSEMGLLTRLAQNDDHSQASTSEVEVLVEKDKIYAIAIDGFESSTGQIVLNISLEEDKQSPPSNDYPSGALAITSLSNSIYANNLFATGKANSFIDQILNAEDGSVWWKWTADNNTFLSIDTRGSEIDTILVLCEQNSDQLKLLSSNDNYFGSSSLLSFKPVAEKTYYIGVGGKNGERGNFWLNFNRFNEITSGEEVSRNTLVQRFSEQLDTLPLTLSAIGDLNAGTSATLKLQNFTAGKSYTSWRWDSSPYDTVLGAEFKHGVKIKTVAHEDGFQSLYRVSGGSAYSLKATASDNAWIELSDWLLFEPGSSVSWWGMLQDQSGVAETNVEYSLDDGVSWASIDQPASDTADQFTNMKVFCRDLSGKVAKIRFILENKSSSSSSTTPEWFIDDISFEGIHRLSAPVSFSMNGEISEIPLSESTMQVFFTERNDLSTTGGMGTPSIFIPYHSDNVNLFFEADLLTNRWYESPWYGYYMKSEQNDWIFTPSRGWQYFGGLTLGGGWIYDLELEWLWTNDKIYPWMYQSSKSLWVYDYSILTKSRYFHFGPLNP